MCCLDAHPWAGDNSSPQEYAKGGEQIYSPCCNLNALPGLLPHFILLLRLQYWVPVCYLQSCILLDAVPPLPQGSWVFLCWGRAAAMQGQARLST